VSAAEGRSTPSDVLASLPDVQLVGSVHWTCRCLVSCRFNGGSALKAGSVAVSAVVATHVAACCSGAVWTVLSWRYHKPSAVAVMNGAVAGLAGITPASGYIGIPVACAVLHHLACLPA
jgi:hypothetical protein